MKTNPRFLILIVVLALVSVVAPVAGNALAARSDKFAPPVCPLVVQGGEGYLSASGIGTVIFPLPFDGINSVVITPSVEGGDPIPFHIPLFQRYYITETSPTGFSVKFDRPVNIAKFYYIVYGSKCQ